MKYTILMSCGHEDVVDLVGKNSDRERKIEYFKSYGLCKECYKKQMEEKVKNFSSGMVSRLGFAIATIGETAEILILDEVLSVGDEFFRKKSLKRVQEMIHGGSTVLLVSHSMGTILENCDRVVWIEKGKMKMCGEPKVVCEAYRKMNLNE